MSSLSMPQYSIVDLFAGAGGLSFGFLQTGRFRVKAAFEIDPEAQKTYLHNHGEQVSMYCDVEDALSPEIKTKLGQIDVVIGGPPCQGFSNANRQKNHVISQNNFLVKKFVQAVLHLNPVAFVMENVSMLQSNVHCFYVGESDRATIKQYGIVTTPTEIPLLDETFRFDGIVSIIEDSAKIAGYLWDEDDYLVLNVIYKARKNREKLKATLTKHQKQLLMFAPKLISRREANDHIKHHDNLAGEALRRYFAGVRTDDDAISLCDSIETSIMLQRMLSKAQEIHDNHIAVTGYTQERRLAAQVTSMAVTDYIESILGAENNGYSITKGVLAAAAFGVPQKRMRFVMIGVKKTKADVISLPNGEFTEDNFRTVEEAIKDLEDVEAAIKVTDGNNGVRLFTAPEYISDLGRQLRNSPILYNHVSTATTPEALERFKAIKQGNNFHSLPLKLKSSYSDARRTQNTIYLRLKYDEPSGTVVNVRKSMWIHPIKHRALSIREAARLQTFPDSFMFCGVKNSQYQQVGNAVPPLLAKVIAEHLCGYLDR